METYCKDDYLLSVTGSHTRKTDIHITYELKIIIEHVGLRGELRKKYSPNYPSGKPQVPLKVFITNQLVVERVTYIAVCYLSVCTRCS